MGIEFAADSDPAPDLDGASELPTRSIATEDVRITLGPPETARASARRADEIWVSKMAMLGTLRAGLADGNPAILALSDGVTSHMVPAFGFAKEADDYVVLYHDPWPPERGSFLEAGKNIAGCAATLWPDGSGLWAVKAAELIHVLDSMIVVGPPEQQDGRDH